MPPLRVHRSKMIIRGGKNWPLQIWGFRTVRGASSHMLHMLWGMEFEKRIHVLEPMLSWEKQTKNWLVSWTGSLTMCLFVYVFVSFTWWCRIMRRYSSHARLWHGHMLVFYLHVKRIPRPWRPAPWSARTHCTRPHFRWHNFPRLTVNIFFHHRTSFHIVKFVHWRGFFRGGIIKHRQFSLKTRRRARTG